VTRARDRDGVGHKRPFAVVVAGVVLLLGAADSHAKLVFRTDDVYVRQANLIVVARTISTGTHRGVSVATLDVLSVLMGPSPDSTIDVRDYPEGEEDAPQFRVGERALLLLSPDPSAPGVFQCVGAQATKRVYRPEWAAEWDTQLERIARLVEARDRPQEARIAALMELLDSKDDQLAAAASNYLNYLLTGEEDEPWMINPPKRSSNWSWQDYFERNVVAHRKKWKAWWRQQRSRHQLEGGESGR
jgi:hypothetical protein